MIEKLKSLPHEDLVSELGIVATQEALYPKNKTYLNKRLACEKELIKRLGGDWKGYCRINGIVTYWIEVYRDTIEDHNEDNNLSAILVTEDFAEQYFDECIAMNYEDHITFDNWIMNHEADETMDFYQYANKHKAIIDIKHY